MRAGASPPPGGDGGLPGWVLDSAPVLMWLADPASGARTFNRRWHDFTGAAGADGLDWAGAVHPEDRDRYLRWYGEALADGGAMEVQFRLRRHDGTWRWILERTEPGPAGLVGAGSDITDLRSAEDELRRSREDLEQALTAGNMGTWMWDRPSGRVLRDPNLHAMYGLGLGDLLGSYEEWVALVHPDDRAAVVAEVERAMAEGGTYELEHRIVRPDGEVRWLERRGEAYCDESGTVAGTRGLVIDITARKQAEEERTRLLAAEQEARRLAEVSARRVLQLQRVTGGLADAREAVDVAEVIVVQGAEGLGAASAALCLVTPDGEEMEVVRHVGYDGPTMERFQVFSVDADLPASEAIRTGEMVLLSSLAERDARYPALTGIKTLNASHAVVPLGGGSAPSGAIALGWHSERTFDDEDRRFLTALAQQASQALDRVRLHEAERRRSVRQDLVAEASRLLGSSLDYQRTLAEVARLIVPTVAEACSVHLVEQGAITTVAQVHADPTAAAPGDLPDLSWCLPPDRVLEVVSTAATVVADLDGEDPQAPITGPGRDERTRSPGLRSALALPLRSGEETLGVLAVAGGRRRVPALVDDVAFLEDLASRAAAAVANGRAHQDRAAIAHSLQRSLLPPEAPLLPGLEVAARYHPVGHEVEVGGDFYDMFPAGGGRWGVVIGDVSGKGVPAASFTALARHTVRTAARWETSASAVLRVLNDSILEQGAGERFCTIALAFLRAGAGGEIRVSQACGGHPLPLLVDPGGTIATAGRPGTAIGLVPDPELTDVEYVLGPGQSLVMYTDGVVEARSSQGRFADGLLEEVLARHPGRSAEAAADAVDQALLDFVGAQPRDDITLVVLRRPPGALHVCLPPSPTSVAAARREVRAWMADQPAGDPRRAEDLVLLVSELVTNAVRVARSSVEVYVSADDGTVTVDVADDGPGFDDSPSFSATAAPESTTGRGLHIVGSLADECQARSGWAGTLVRGSIRLAPPGGTGG